MSLPSFKPTDLVSKEITAWFHKENEYNFTPAQYTSIIIRLFKQSIKRFHLNLDVQDEQFNKSIMDAVCTFYLAKQKCRSISGPQRNFYVPSGWNQLCEECWQDMLFHSFFTIDYWDNFWKCYEFGKMPSLFIDIQPFLTAVLPMYVRRRIDLLVERQYIVKDEGTFVRFADGETDGEEDDHDFYYVKSKKQRKIQNDSGQ